ncbi:hypothetical protein KB529_08400 [Lactococcus lactis subsp. lactis]|uniref:hypothetical protein n=1 Tax=Lactococcus lactis TaxID=1358 RepID=UPI00071DC75B|nr:hypothetical protein [Lactococcus lactis]MDT3324731.1 hypothetical protein [Bacillota bacterium]KST79714.1 hypothetical protein LK231_1001 [Lactococcus lactis subsp. lactis]MBR8679437.1 hypothetical protein [Lactococcus lactis subsp. lactis]MBR8681797.1 hypothetical protein [Lactococcus lactis subsp. lactis]MBR8686921.1 hypothetical protein [Lactococcus lactis subsp. lactis]
MSEELYYRHYFLQIYEILREDEQNKKLSIKEKNVLADALVLNERKEPVLQILGQLYMRLEFWNRPADDEILKGGMKAPVRTLYEELKADKNITSSQKFITGVEAYRPITWNDALYGNKMTEDDGFIGGGYVTFDSNEKYKSMEERIAVPDNEIVRNAKSSFAKLFQVGCLGFALLILLLVLLGFALKMVTR